MSAQQFLHTTVVLPVSDIYETIAWHELALDLRTHTLMPHLQNVFTELAAILRPYASKLAVEKDTPTDLYVDTRHIQKNKKPLFFGAVQLKKNCVSFHLMPVYLKPALLSGISPELKKRMQGKACFNFSDADKPLFKELAALTKSGYASYKEQGFV